MRRGRVSPLSSAVLLMHPSRMSLLRANLASAAGLLLIIIGILSAFQVPAEWVMIVGVGFCGVGLFLFLWGSARRQHRRRR